MQQLSELLPDGPRSSISRLLAISLPRGNHPTKAAPRLFQRLNLLLCAGHWQVFYYYFVAPTSNLQLQPMRPKQMDDQHIRICEV